MRKYTFEFQSRDAYGCTKIPKEIFRDALALTHLKPIVIKRPNGNVYEIDALKCHSRQKALFYQIDFTGLGISKNALVTLWPEGANHLSMTVVEQSEVMWRNGGVVDAIVDLQRRLDEVEDHLEITSF